MGAAEIIDSSQMTPEEYLAMDRAALDCKYEYMDGRAYAMAGGSWAHSKIMYNLGALIHATLRGKPCQGTSAELRVKIKQNYVYPDATIICGRPELSDDARDILLNPAVIFEVLSPSTEAYDRGRKSRAYRDIASLSEYVLISQEQPLVEHFLRQPDGSWLLRVYQAGERVKLVAPDMELEVDELYKQAFDV